MLGKLMKHEWKDTCKFGGFMLVLIFGFTVLGILTFQAPMWQGISDGVYRDENPFSSILNLMSILMLIGYAFSLFAIDLAMTVYLAIHFYKTMYTDQGYLTHTLPVKPGEIMFSKTLIGGIWKLIIMFAVILSVTVILFVTAVTMVPLSSLLSGMGEMAEDLWNVLWALQKDFGLNFWFYPVYFAASFLLTPFITLIPIFGACSLGQLFAKQRVVMSVLIFFGIRMVSGMINGLIQMIFQFIFLGNMADSKYYNIIFQSGMSVGLFFSVGFTVVMYWLSYWVISRKLNLE